MDLNDIEKKLEKTFGLTIFDYIFLFGKKAVLPKDISITGKDKILSEYIVGVNSFFKETQQPEVPINENNLEETFFEAMHNLYVFRYLLGIKMFAEYEIVRIETWFETKMLDMPSNDFLDPIPETFSFKIPDSLLIDALGNFDEYSSTQSEKETNTIKAYLSSVAFGRQKSATLYSLFRNYTVKEFVPRLLEKDTLNLCVIIMTKIGEFLSTKVYEFLSQKFTLVEAKNNVLSLITKQLKTNNYYSDLEKFREELQSLIKAELSKIKSINEDTSTILINEFWNVFKNNFENLFFFPENYYSIEFRKSDESREAEKEFSNVIDLYLIENDGTPWNMPVETYAIEFTREAKENIFNLITNGFVNPNYTLNDYLFLYK